MTDKWGKLVEERLQAAFADGQFADLPGKGQPLTFAEDPLADPDQWLARHILRNSGMNLPWVEERQRIEKTLAEAKKRLAGAFAAYAVSSVGELPRPAAASRSQRALAVFGAEVEALNDRIRTYNLTVPHVSLQRCLIDVEHEVSRLRRQLSHGL